MLKFNFEKTQFFSIKYFFQIPWTRRVDLFYTGVIDGYLRIFKKKTLNVETIDGENAVIIILIIN